MAIQNLQPLCHWVINILFAIGTASILLRIYVKAFISKLFGWDDWAMAGTLVFNAGQQAVLYLFLKYGGGKKMAEVIAENPNNITNILKILFTEEIYYIWLHFWIKMCFLLFYLRLSHIKTFVWVVYVTMVLNTLNTITIWLIYSLQCRPLKAFWYPELYPNAKCLKAKVTYFVPGSLELFVDLIILFLPLTVVWNLQMTLRRRLAVISVVTMGGSAVLVSGLRLIVVNQFATNPDFTYTLGNMILVSAVEIQVAIFAANMPAMKVLFTKWKEGTLSGSGSKPTDGYVGTAGYQLSKFRAKKDKKNTQADDGRTSFDGGDGSTRHLTKRGSDEELPRRKSGIITVTKEYMVSDVSGKDESPQAYPHV